MDRVQVIFLSVAFVVNFNPGCFRQSSAMEKADPLFTLRCI